MKRVLIAIGILTMIVGVIGVITEDDYMHIDSMRLEVLLLLIFVIVVYFILRSKKK